MTEVKIVSGVAIIGVLVVALVADDAVLAHDLLFDV